MTRRFVVVVLLALVAPSCSGGEDPAVDGGVSGTLRVFAAASLTEAFGDLAQAFEAEYPDVRVALTFGGSSSLARQVNDGAPADVLVTADERTVATVVDAGNAVDPLVIARNRLVIVVEPGNPQGITGLADLAEPGLIVILCAPEVPCGALAAAAFSGAGIEVEPASREENVRAVVSKVALGEADAGIAYATDAAAGDQVDAVAIDGVGEPGLEATYPMVITAGAENPGAAAAWAEFVRSAEGRQVLRSHGFLGP